MCEGGHPLDPDEYEDAESDSQRREMHLSYPGKSTENLTSEEISELIDGPCERSFGFATEEEYELAADITVAIADVIAGNGHYAGHDIVTCPNCGDENQVRHVAFPGPIPKEEHE